MGCVTTLHKSTDKAAALLSERAGNLPVWVRANTRGLEHYSSLRREELQTLARQGRIRWVEVSGTKRSKRVRLFHLGSVFAYLESCENARIRQRSGTPKHPLKLMDFVALLLRLLTLLTPSTDRLEPDSSSCHGCTVRCVSSDEASKE